MAFTDKSPASWLGAGYNAATGKVEFNTNDAATNKLLTELTDAEADEATGDIRKLMFGLVDGLYVKLKAKNDALAAADRPNHFSISRSSFVNDDGSINRTVAFTFRLTAGVIEVADEAP